MLLRYHPKKQRKADKKQNKQMLFLVSILLYLERGKEGYRGGANSDDGNRSFVLGK